ANLKQNTESAEMHSRTLSGEVADELASKSGMSKRNLYNLLAVYRNRLDLFYRVRDGEIAIGRAYQQMKDDEKPNTLRQIVDRFGNSGVPTLPNTMHRCID